MKGATLCADAVHCPHQPTLPTLDYLAGRRELAAAAVKAMYADYPPSHQRAIWRARADYPNRRREQREQRWARAWMRRRR